jgi:glucokinase
VIVLKKHYAVGIDIGGTKLRLGLVSEELSIERCFITQEHQYFAPLELADFVAKSLAQLLEGQENVLGVGVGYPGPIWFTQGCTFSYSNLRHEGWEKVPLAKMIEERVGFPVLVDNDANLAGLAEVRLGAGKEYRDVVYITISTGTGGAIFFNRQLYRGFLGSAGEFGHMVVDLRGPQCKCGNRGCVMSLLSGLGLEKFIREEPSCRFLFQDGNREEDCVKKFVELAQCGNPSALSAMKPLVEYLCIAFLNVVHILNPEAIVVGGALGKALLALFHKDIREYLSAHLPKEVVERTEIREAKLNDWNGVLGGAILVFESFAASV